MAISTEWILNKLKQKIYPISHAKVVIRGNSTVDADLTTLEEALERLVQSGATDHITSQLTSPRGVHGIRYLLEEEKLQFLDNETKEWVTIKTGGGGGVPIGSMKSFTISYSTEITALKLYASDPGDIVWSDGTVLAKWGGTKIIRKVGGYPENYKDGELVVEYRERDTYKTTPYIDTGLDPDTEYFYRAFPYTSEGTYGTTSEQNGASASPNIAPGDVSELEIQYGNKQKVETAFGNKLCDQVLIKFKAPSSIKGYEVAGVYLTYSVGRIPTDVTQPEGASIQNSINRVCTSDETIVMDIRIPPQEQFGIRIFPYILLDGKRVFNKNLDPVAISHNTAMVCHPGVNSHMVGVEVDMEKSTNSYTRLAGAVGKSTGSGFNVFPMYGNRKRCCVADDGAVLAFYGDPAYTETGKLTQPVTVDDEVYPIGTPAQVMVYQPKFYYLVDYVLFGTESDCNTSQGLNLQMSTKYYISDYNFISGYTINDSGEVSWEKWGVIHPAFRKQNKELPYILLSAYEACPVSSSGDYMPNYDYGDRPTRLGSRASTGYTLVYPLMNSNPLAMSSYTPTKTDFRQLAKGLESYDNSDTWQIPDIYTMAVTQLLFLIEYATFDSQKAIGQGIFMKSNTIVQVGVTSSLGNNSGNVTISVRGESVTAVSYRGEENLWGNSNCLVDGVIFDANARFCTVKLFTGSKSSQLPNSDYYDVISGFSLETTTGYTKYFCKAPTKNPYGEVLFFPANCTGTSAAPVGDYFYMYYTSQELNLYWGGFLKSSESSHLGLFSFVGSVALSDKEYMGSRLVYKPPINAQPIL